ncbi:MAG: M1 family metallopeptidase [Aliidongia sp.]
MMPSNFSPRALPAAVMPLALILAVPASAQTAARAPFSFDQAYGRLPKNVVPIDYRIAIKPNMAASTLTGIETVTLEFREATATIQFNSLNETLSDVRLDGKPVKEVVSSDEQQITTVTLKSPAPVGRHRLSFSYSGKIETAPQGLFAQPYVKPGGGDGVLLSTQFEETDARRMFPCWDEPAFRATFELTATVPADWAVISNMPIGKRAVHGAVATTSFRRSPKMPSYLVEFSAGDLAEISTTKDGVNFGIWAVRGQEAGGATALANAQQILADYNDYFGTRFPLPKLDSIAVPGGFSGAMENWGAITYNDQVLLLTPSSTLANRQTVYSIQAHEMAHQWNGDLVTMGWWDDIWLNESFASWRAAKETDLRNPSWNWWEAEDAGKEDAMSADARASSHAIEQHVTDELQAANAFDPQITYAKGEAVLRMFEAYLGPDIFRDGIRRFMKAHAYSNATSADLWNALSAVSGRNVGAIAAGWTERPGFPLVSVAASCDSTGNRTVALSQQRFLLQGADANAAHWSIPLQIRVGATGAPQPVLLTENAQSVAAGKCDQPLSVNADAVGYYRTKYDDATLTADTANFGALRDGDRIALLDDQWALVGAGLQKLPSYLVLASSMGTDFDERAWIQIVDALSVIEYDERGTPGHDAFTAYARTILKPVADRLGWDAKPDDTPGVQRLRQRALGALGLLGDPAVIAEARKRFTAFAADRGAIRPDDQETVLSIIAHSADASDFEKLHAIAKSAGNETELARFYAALMQVRDPALAAEAARIALSPEIPPQADHLRFQLVTDLHDENPALSWQVFTENADALLAPQAGFAPLLVAQGCPDIFWNSLPLDQLESWVSAHVPAEMADFVARGMETARFKLAKKAALTMATDDYLKSQATAPAGTAGH